MRLLRSSCQEDAWAAEPPEQRQFTEPPALLRLQQMGASRHRHPGGVVEASDVRRDERRLHASKRIPSGAAGGFGGTSLAVGVRWPFRGKDAGSPCSG